MRKAAFLYGLMLVFLTGTAARAEFYVIAVGSPPAGTAIKSLPYTINSPGFYYLTGNLTATGTAITVDANNVTLDLMGFCLTGPGKASGYNYGIEINANQANVEIRNGTIRSFGERGIDSHSSTNNIRVLGIRANDNNVTGIGLFGNNNVVINCSAFNYATGIYGGYGSLAKGNQVWQNTSYGIYTCYGCSAIANTAQNNGIGISAEYGCAVLDNSVYANSDKGIKAISYCTLMRNTAYNNTHEGLVAGTDCTIIHNTVDGLTYGSGCTVKDNTVY